MPVEAFLFVSKRLQPVVAALICLAIVQLTLASRSPEVAALGVARVAISR